MLNTPYEYIYRNRRKNSSFWEYLCELCGVKPPRVLPTRVSIVCFGDNPNNIERLTKAGVEIRYLVVVTPEFNSLKSIPNLETRLFNGPDLRLVTSHFILSENPRLMWIERNHPMGSLAAYDCEWSPKKFAHEDPRYETLSKLFEEAWKQGIPAVYK